MIKWRKQKEHENEEKSENIIIFFAHYVQLECQTNLNVEVFTLNVKGTNEEKKNEQKKKFEPLTIQLWHWIALLKKDAS